MIVQLISEIKITKKEVRNFGITVAFIFLVIGAILLWRSNTSYLIFIIVGFVLLGIGLIIPIILKPIYFTWMVLGNILGWIMTRIILGFLFYVIITPIGLIPRLFGKQFIKLKWNKTDSTYWNYRTESLFEKENYEKQF